MSEENAVSTESTKKPGDPKKRDQAKTETVINCSKSGGHITDIDGVKCAVGSPCKLPLAACELLVTAGVARYPARSDS